MVQYSNIVLTQEVKKTLKNLVAGLTLLIFEVVGK